MTRANTTWTHTVDAATAELTIGLADAAAQVGIGVANIEQDLGLADDDAELQYLAATAGLSDDPYAVLVNEWQTSYYTMDESTVRAMTDLNVGMTTALDQETTALAQADQTYGDALSDADAAFDHALASADEGYIGQETDASVAWLQGEATADESDLNALASAAITETRAAAQIDQSFLDAETGASVAAVRSGAKANQAYYDAESGANSNWLRSTAAADKTYLDGETRADSNWVRSSAAADKSYRAAETGASSSLLAAGASADKSYLDAESNASAAVLKGTAATDKSYRDSETSAGTTLLAAGVSADAARLNSATGASGAWWKAKAATDQAYNDAATAAEATDVAANSAAAETYVGAISAAAVANSQTLFAAAGTPTGTTAPPAGAGSPTTQGMQTQATGGHSGGWWNPLNWHRGLYTGDPNAADEVYQAGLDAAGPSYQKNAVYAHQALDVVGMVPGAGAVADGVNAALHTAEGNYREAAIIGAGFGLGVAGDAIGKLTRHGDDAAKVVSKYGDDLASEASALKNCFPAGTLVATSQGLRPIETVAAGERVWALDLTSGQWRPCLVLQTFRTHYQGHSVFVRVAAEAEETIEATLLHPFWVVRGEELDDRPSREHLAAVPENVALPGRWIDAGDLRVGDELLLRDGRITPVQGVRSAPYHGVVYNFEVDELHCYAVGWNGVLVHNDNGLEKLARNADELNANSQEVAAVKAALNADITDAGIGVLNTTTGKIHLAPSSSLNPPGHVALLKQLGLQGVDVRGFVVAMDKAGKFVVENLSGQNVGKAGSVGMRMATDIFDAIKQALAAAGL